MSTRFFFVLFLAAASLPLWAQTNAAKDAAAVTSTEISSDSAEFDNNTRRLVYQGNVLVSDPKIKMHCARLTVDMPPEGQSRPTNVVAETGVVIDFLDEKGMTNHVTADKAVYAYSIVGAVTNGTVTFTGTPDNPPKVETSQFDAVGEPLIWDMVRDRYILTNDKIKIKQSAINSTNGSPMNLFK